MSETFQVLTEGWIPVVDLEGNQRKLGILQTLEQAHTLREISDASAMVEYSLYRFLAVFLMDALRPEEVGDLEDLLEEGEFPKEVLEGYVQLCREEGVSFDLFDTQRPFLQTPYCEKWDKVVGVGKLDYTIPSGNNHVHFEHRNLDEIQFEFDEAARLLISAQIFCTPGGRGVYKTNVNGSPPYYTVVKGRNLFETLVYSLSVIDRIDIPFDEPPVWWRNTEVIEPNKEVLRTSWLFGMLFPVRRIFLEPQNGVVSKIYQYQGLNFLGKDAWEDPFVTYIYGKDGRRNWKPEKNKAIWRNLSDLIDVKTKSAPVVLQQYFQLEKESEEASISLYGVQTDNGSYLDMAHYDLKVPAYLTKGEEYIEYIRACIKAAEICAVAVKSSLCTIPKESNNGKKQNTQRKQVGISKEMQENTVQRFYDLCEIEFWRSCRNLSGEGVDLQAAYDEWCSFLLESVRMVREETLGQVILNCYILARLAENEKEIKKAEKMIRKGR